MEKEKCFTRLWNLKKHLEFDEHAKFFFNELQDSSKCDKYFDFREVKNTAFKRLDSTILKRLQQSKLTDEDNIRLKFEYLRLKTYFEELVNSQCTITDIFLVR